MNNQVNTIDVDQMWRYGGDKNACINYKLYAKVDRKYICPIINNIGDVALDLKNKRLFTPHITSNENKIYNISSLCSDNIENLLNNLKNKSNLSNDELTNMIYKLIITNLK